MILIHSSDRRCRDVTLDAVTQAQQVVKAKRRAVLDSPALPRVESVVSITASTDTAENVAGEFSQKCSRVVYSSGSEGFERRRAIRKRQRATNS